MAARFLMLAVILGLAGGCALKAEPETLSKSERLAQETRVPIIFTVKSKVGGFGGEWIGKISLAEWYTVKNGNPVVKFLSFTDCFFFNENGERVYNTETKGPAGTPLGYSNTIMLNVDGILRMMPGFTTELAGDTLKIHINKGLEDSH